MVNSSPGKPGTLAGLSVAAYAIAVMSAPAGDFLITLARG